MLRIGYFTLGGFRRFPGAPGCTGGTEAAGAPATPQAAGVS
jgi:hypothetical protein